MQLKGNEEDLEDERFTVHMTKYETASLVDRVQTWRYRVDSRQHGFFIAKKEQKPQLQPLVRTDELNSVKEKMASTPTTPGALDDMLDYAWSVGALAEYEEGFFDGIPTEDQFVCFADPSTFAMYPGWMLRNLLVLVRQRWKLRRIQILCYRDVQSRRDGAKSIILTLELDKAHSVDESIPSSPPCVADMPKVTGWERNHAGKVMSRVANLGEYLDPQRYVTRIFRA